MTRERTDSPAEKDVELVVERYVEALQAGETPDRAEIIARHPEIAPQLARRLQLVDDLCRLAAAGEGAPSEDERVRATQCPYCNHPIGVAVPPVDEATCDSCGSTFRVDAETERRSEKSPLPESIGRFRVLALLGRGAFGVVYRAIDPELDRVVALKVPCAGTFASPQEEERFLREARSAAALQHPAIVRVHETAQEDGVPYIVSEYVEGITLKDLLENKRLTFRETTELVARIAGALDHAHRRRVIHRDVKPGNILVDASGLPHVTDFGLARHDGAEITVTLDGQVLGTPAYMSPEQAAGSHHRVDARTDVYGLGAVLYEMLTAERPFTGQRDMVIYQVLHDEPRPPRRLNDRIPRDLETICLKAMDREPGRRYATAGDMRDDLQLFLHSRPIRARPVGNAERGWRWCRRNPTVASLTALAAILIAAIAVGSTATALYLDSALTESRGRLVRLHLAAATRHEDRGDVSAALPHLAEATELCGHDLGRGRVCRSRFAAALQSCPRPVREWIHPAAVELVSFGADDRRILTACTDGAVRVFDVETGELLIAPLAHTGRIRCAEFDPTGQHIATAGPDQKVRIWDLETGALALPPLEHKGRVLAVRYNSDGRLLATGSTDSTAQVWDATTGAPVGSLPSVHKGGVTHVAFVGPGDQVLSADESGLAAVWDWRTGVVINSLKHERAVVHVEASRDGLRIASVSEDGDARVWRPRPTLQRVGQPLRHDLLIPSPAPWDPVVHTSFSPAGFPILVTSRRGVVRIWNGGEDTTPAFDDRQVYRRARFSRDGLSVLALNALGVARVRDARAGRGGLTLRDGRQTVLAEFSSTGRCVLTVDPGGSVRLWDLSSRASSCPPCRHEGPIVDLEFSRDGSRLVVASADGRARVWDTTTGRAAAPALPHLPASLLAASFAANEGRDTIRTWSRDALRSWDAKTSNFVAAHDVEDDAVSAHFTRTRRGEHRVVLIRRGGSVEVRDARNGKSVIGPLACDFAVTCAALGPGERVVVVAGSEGRVRALDATNGDTLWEVRTRTRTILDVAFDRTGRLIATAGDDGSVRIRNAASGAALSRRLVQTGAVQQVRFGPAGRLVATIVPDDRTVWVWDWQHTEQVTPPLALASRGTALAFHPGGHRLATGDADGVVRIWELPVVDRPVAELALTAEVFSGRRLEVDGELSFLSVAEFRSAEHAFRKQFPAAVAPLATDGVLAWKRLRAAECARAEEWVEAARHLDSLIEADPEDWRSHVSRARARAALGEWERAGADFAQAIEARADEPACWIEKALCHLAREDVDGYRATCQSLLARFRGTRSPDVAHEIARTCVLAAAAVDEPEAVVELAALAVGACPSPRFSTTLAAALHRAGRFADAQKVLDRVAATGGAVTELFLALNAVALGERGNHWMTTARLSIAREHALGAGGAVGLWGQIELRVLLEAVEACVPVIRHPPRGSRSRSRQPQ